MAKIELDSVISGYNLAKINNNFQKIEDELNTKVLYRNPPTGEQNQLEDDIDANGYSLYNLRSPTLKGEPVTLGFLQDMGVGNLAISDWQIENFIGDNTTTVFPLSFAPASLTSIFVTIDGISATPVTDFYLLSEQELIFLYAPYDGAEISVRYGTFLGTGVFQGLESISSATSVPGSVSLVKEPTLGVIKNLKPSNSSIVLTEGDNTISIEAIGEVNTLASVNSLNGTSITSPTVGSELRVKGIRSSDNNILVSSDEYDVILTNNITQNEGTITGVQAVGTSGTSLVKTDVTSGVAEIKKIAPIFPVKIATDITDTNKVNISVEGISSAGTDGQQLAMNGTTAMKWVNKVTTDVYNPFQIDSNNVITTPTLMQNYVLASPATTYGKPQFRQLTIADIPPLSYAQPTHDHSTSNIISGVFPVVRGGTGLNSVGTNGQVLKSDGTNIVWGTVSGGGDVYLGNTQTFTGRNIFTGSSFAPGTDSTDVNIGHIRVNQSNTFDTNVKHAWSVFGKSTTAGGSNVDSTCVGVAGFGFNISGTTSTWGIYGEAWNGDLTTAPTSSARLSNEVACIAQYHNNTADIFGLDVCFKNRGDFVSTVLGGLGSNKYNNNSTAVRIWSQSSSTAGEYCGWNKGIYFAPSSLQRTVTDRAIAVDMTNIHTGDTDCIKFPDGTIQNSMLVPKLYLTNNYSGLAPITIRASEAMPALIDTYGTTSTISQFLRIYGSDGYTNVQTLSGLTTDVAIKVVYNGTQYYLPMYRA